MKKVFIASARIAPAGLELLRKHGVQLVCHTGDLALSADEFQVKFQGCDAAIITLADQIRRDVLELAAAGNPPTILFTNYGVGYNNIDVETAKSLGIFITNTPEVLTDASADTAMFLLLSVARRSREAERLMRTGRFEGWSTLKNLGVDLSGKTMGIVGFGRIGQAVAARAAAFGMEIIYTRKQTVHSPLGTQTDFETLLRKSDVISIHTPLTPETTHLFTRDEFEKMKTGVILINTSRGAVIKESDLVSALRAEKFFGVGLDVYEFEPKVTAELYEFENAVLMPHIGAATTETRNRMSVICAENILDAFAGRRPRNLVW